MDDDEQLASSFRPKHKRIFLGVCANLVLTALLLGLPYLRGQSIATTQREHFARFASCLFDAEESAMPGLTLPPGEREHFASQVLSADPDWPLRCRRSLAALAPEDAVFLWPSVKRAGEDLRAVVALLDRELVALHEARGQGNARVPSRPLDAFAKLQAALTLMARATDQSDAIDQPAIRFTRAAAFLAPARLPLTAAESARLELASADGTLEALAIDARGVSWLRVADGKIDRERVKRANLLRAIVWAGSEPHLVWATPRERCQERDDRCAQRATGVAPYDKGGGALPSPSWLAGHPAGRPDRVMHLETDGRIDLIAVASGGYELRRFTLPARELRKANAPPLAPRITHAIPSDTHESDLVLLPRANAVVHAAQSGDDQVHARVLYHPVRKTRKRHPRRTSPPLQDLDLGDLMRRKRYPRSISPPHPADHPG